MCSIRNRVQNEIKSKRPTEEQYDNSEIENKTDLTTYEDLQRANEDIYIYRKYIQYL